MLYCTESHLYTIYTTQRRNANVVVLKLYFLFCHTTLKIGLVSSLPPPPSLSLSISFSSLLRNLSGDVISGFGSIVTQSVSWTTCFHLVIVFHIFLMRLFCSTHFSLLSILFQTLILLVLCLRRFSLCFFCFTL